MNAWMWALQLAESHPAAVRSRWLQRHNRPKRPLPFASCRPYDWQSNWPMTSRIPTHEGKTQANQRPDRRTATAFPFGCASKPWIGFLWVFFDVLFIVYVSISLHSAVGACIWSCLLKWMVLWRQQSFIYGSLVKCITQSVPSRQKSRDFPLIQLSINTE